MATQPFSVFDLGADDSSVDSSHTVDPIVFVDDSTAPELRHVGSYLDAPSLEWRDCRSLMVAHVPAVDRPMGQSTIPSRMRVDRVYSVTSGPVVVLALLAPTLAVGATVFLLNR